MELPPTLQYRLDIAALMIGTGIIAVQSIVAGVMTLLKGGTVERP